MNWLAISAVILMFGAVLYVIGASYLRWKRLYDNLKAGDLKTVADLLLRSGREGGFIVITEKGSGRFVQFRKYIHRKGEFGLELGFPKAPWSETYYPPCYAPEPLLVPKPVRPAAT
jgi:hypothetical protein